MAKESSTLLKLLPLILLVLIVAAAGYIGYYIYLTSQQIGEKASQRMNKKNVVWTKDGMKVGVKSIENENYVDKTQSWVVKAWNLGQPAPASDSSSHKQGKKKQ